HHEFDRRWPASSNSARAAAPTHGLSHPCRASVPTAQSRPAAAGLADERTRDRTNLDRVDTGWGDRRRRDRRIYRCPGSSLAPPSWGRLGPVLRFLGGDLFPSTLASVLGN